MECITQPNHNCRSSEVKAPSNTHPTRINNPSFFLRNIFFPKLFHTVPNLQRKMATLTSTEFLKAIIYERSTIVLVAKYVHHILEVFYAVPVYRAG
jgi:hypothetical protein